MTITLDFLRHNGSTCVATLELDGPVPRVGELIHVPAHLHEDMEHHDVAIVTHVRYRIDGDHLVAGVTAMASHDTSEERARMLAECGWLPE